MSYIKLNSLNQMIDDLFAYSPILGKDILMPVLQVMWHSSLDSFTTNLLAAHIAWNTKASQICKDHIEVATILATKEKKEIMTDLHIAIVENQLVNHVDIKTRSLIMLSDDIRINIKPNEQTIDFCRHNSCSDVEIHDTVALTCVMGMLCRYVSGLNVDQ
jgi:hypothetical protein